MLSIIGIIGIIIGGQVVVNLASSIALAFGMSENLIGLTIVAIGTSLPEFMTSVVAAKKGESDIAIGNIVGSNLFNILFILGLSATIHPIPIQPIVFVDMIIMLIVTILGFILSATKKTVSKGEGIILSLMYLFYLLSYAIYISCTFIRNYFLQLSNLDDQEESGFKSLRLEMNDYI